MTDNEKKLNEQELTEVSGGFEFPNINFDKILEQIVTALKQTFPGIEDAIAAIQSDAKTISPDIQNLINLIGKTKVIEELKKIWK